MFCGILPWNWFATSLTDAAGSLIAGGNLIKKVLFPAEVLPLVSVLANMMHFFLGLPILLVFLIVSRHYPDALDLVWFPIAVIVQLVFTSALALILAALTVHFRDIRDLLANILTLWFFATPIIYPVFQTERAAVQVAVRPESVHAPGRVVSGDSLLQRADRALEVAAGPRRRVRAFCSSRATGCSTGCAIRLPRPYETRRQRTRGHGGEVLTGSCPRVLRGGRVDRERIELVNVSKIYRRYSGKQFATLKSALLQRSLVRDLRPSETFPALTDVSFSVPKGSTFAVIGRNGSGKSTALKLVAGITKPTTGSVRVDGRISALIELGAGFHPEISGRENVFINGIMLGLTKRQIQDRFDDIVDFAELREFIDAPVKTYSSGMYMRLGFAVAIHVDPDVLLVDEVLAVGDEGFTHKCLDKFAEFRRRGKTVLLVTHSLGLVENLCDDAVWLDGGRVQGHGDPKRVVGAYLTAVEQGEQQLMAATTARAVEEADAAGRRRSTRRDADRRRTCSRPPRGAGDRGRSRSSTSRCSMARVSRRSCSTPASRSRCV